MAPSVTQRSARETVESLNWEESEAAFKLKATKKMKEHANRAFWFRTFLLFDARCIPKIGNAPDLHRESYTVG
jgi:hypothetical protein